MTMMYLITKGIIDGFTSIILASTLGLGVLLSAFPVFVYQGTIALFAGVISTVHSRCCARFVYSRNDGNRWRHDYGYWA